MKLVMFTPVNQGSHTASFACGVVKLLVAKGHQLVIVRTENLTEIDALIHDFNAKIVCWNDVPQVKSIISQADMLIYHMGDDYKFYQGCLEWLPKFPGIVCLYDCFLGHLFYGWAQAHRSEADELLQHWYGGSQMQHFFDGLDPTQEMFIETFKHVSSLSEWVCSMADAVLAHSHLGIHDVLRSCAGSVRVLEISTKSATSFNDLGFLEHYAQAVMDLIAATYRSKALLNAVRHFTGLMATWGATETLMNLEDTIKPLSLFETGICEQMP